MRLVRTALLLSVVAGIPAWANLPTWDTSGNSLLNGTYYFREVIYVVGDNVGDLSQQLAVFGNITFNGAGGYTISSATVNECDTSSGCGQQPLSTSGTYSFASNGYGFFTNPLSSSGATFTNYGLISNGILISSATEDGFNSLFIAVPVGTPAVASSFQGAYQISGFIPGSPSTAADVSFTLNPDGAGNLGVVNMTGYFGGGGSTTYTQSSPNVKYTFSNGAGVLGFPVSNTANFYSGQEYLYISPDHNFVFGGSPNGFDMFVGVKVTTGSVNFSGLYYEAGLDEDASQLSSGGFSAPDTFYGSFNAANGAIVGHQRLFSPLFNSVPEGFTFATSYPSTITNGTYTDSSKTTQYAFANGGAIRIGFGIGPLLGINVSLQAPTMSGNGVYLNPNGIVNAASFAPFTAGVSPGEFIVLYGTGLASGNAVASSLPLQTTLGNVQVMINGIPAPLFYVTPNQLAAVVPFGVGYTPPTGTQQIATIQVINNNVASNSVSQFINLTTPGVFSLTANGLGYGAIEHALTGQVVNAASPAQPGEIVSVFMSGLGTTLPAGTDGAAPAQLSNTVQTISAYVGGNAATVAFAGLAPSLAGVYQVNLTIPSNATAGDNVLEILGPDSDNYQALVAVGNGTTNTSAISGGQPHALSVRSHRATRPVTALQRAAPCFVTNPACGGAAK
ncbi:MAG TPA: hypothetical protein VKB79_05185 [Bryobacteraceae bacterium]|nr:hypothetical protein [Bryobacteraceae bacterium]